MGPTWGPPVTCRPQMGPILVQWTLLSGSLHQMDIQPQMSKHWKPGIVVRSTLRYWWHSKVPQRQTAVSLVTTNLSSSYQCSVQRQFLRPLTYLPTSTRTSIYLVWINITYIEVYHQIVHLHVYWSHWRDEDVLRICCNIFVGFAPVLFSGILKSILAHYFLFTQVPFRPRGMTNMSVRQKGIRRMYEMKW